MLVTTEMYSNQGKTMQLNTNPTHVLIVEFDNGANTVRLNLTYTFEEYPKYTVEHYKNLMELSF